MRNYISVILTRRRARGTGLVPLFGNLSTVQRSAGAGRSSGPLWDPILVIRHSYGIQHKSKKDKNEKMRTGRVLRRPARIEKKRAFVFDAFDV